MSTDKSLKQKQKDELDIEMPGESLIDDLLVLGLDVCPCEFCSESNVITAGDPDGENPVFIKFDNGELNIIYSQNGEEKEFTAIVNNCPMCGEYYGLFDEKVERARKESEIADDDAETHYLDGDEAPMYRVEIYGVDPTGKFTSVNTSQSENVRPSREYLESLYNIGLFDKTKEIYINIVLSTNEDDSLLLAFSPEDGYISDDDTLEAEE